MQAKKNSGFKKWPREKVIECTSNRRTTIIRSKDNMTDIV